MRNTRNNKHNNDNDNDNDDHNISDDIERNDRNNDKRDRDGNKINKGSKNTKAKNNKQSDKQSDKQNKDNNGNNKDNGSNTGSNNGDKGEESIFMLPFHIFSFDAPHVGDDDKNDNIFPNFPKRKKTQKDKLQDLINTSNLPKDAKDLALSRLADVSADGSKCTNWIESLCKIPFNKYDDLPIKKDSPQEEIYQYFEKVQGYLDDAVYGMPQVKEEILNYVAQFISTDNKTMPRVIAIAGEPGTGKTSIVRRGFARALNRKMKFISLGGIKDSNQFVGFEYTYQGSRYGLIVQSLIELQTSNPILYFDELDKISEGHDGIEIQNLLVHLTDPVQNSCFHDKYFSGIDIDLSKAIFVFSYNDEKLINPILKDRLHVIKVPTPSHDEKKVILTKYLLKEIGENLGITINDIVISDDIADYIIKKYNKNSKGVRGMKRCIETLLLKINTARFLGKMQKYNCFKNQSNLKFPITITKNMCDELLKDHEIVEDKFISTMYL